VRCCTEKSVLDAGQGDKDKGIVQGDKQVHPHVEYLLKVPWYSMQIKRVLSRQHTTATLDSCQLYFSLLGL
jgi:hypothetical protein